jgi:uncharacterized protein (UPF0264 family)
MKCLHLSKNIGRVFLLASLLFLLSLGVYSQTPEEQIYQAVEQIVTAHPDMKPQVKLIASGLRAISERQSAKQVELQTTIDGQATKITSLEKTLKDSQTSQIASTLSQLAVENDLKAYAKSLEVATTVTSTIAVISLIVNGVQLLSRK